MIQQLFFELIQIVLNNNTELSTLPTEKQWEKIYETGRDQSLTGIICYAIQQLPAHQRTMPRKLLLRWLSQAERTRKRNEEVISECQRLTLLVQNEGLQACVLKGIANIAYYNAVNKEMGMLRSPGDIDLWTWSNGGSFSSVLNFAHKHSTTPIKAYYHHAICTLSESVEVELHYRPSWMCTPLANIRFQHFCQEQSKYTIQDNGFMRPSPLFDAVFQLVHIYRHVFAEGIGLRQLMDYYCVLRNLSHGDRLIALQTIKSIGIPSFCAAIMWIMHHIFLLPADYLLCSPDRKRGKKLLQEIMLAGNFGHADKRINITREENALLWGLMKLRRNFRFFTSYPKEVTFEPFFRIYNLLWRRFYN